MARPRAILFDWDNTLIESWGVIQAAMNETLAAMDCPIWSLDETKARVRASLRDSFPQLFGDRWRKAEEIFYRAFAALHLEHLRPAGAARELLGWAQGAGIPLAVVSNKRGAYLRKEAEHLGWSGYFRCLAGAGDATRDKPARDPVDLVLAACEREPGPDIWFVGDADIDLACAQATNCLPILVRAEAPEAGEFAAAPPALYFPDLANLNRHLAGLA